MKKHIHRLIAGVIACLLLTATVNAQEPKTKKVVMSTPATAASTVNESTALGLMVTLSSPYGLVAQVGYRIFPEFTVRGGIGFFPKIELLSRTLDLSGIPQMDQYKEQLGYTPVIDGSASYSNLSGQLLLDWHPWGTGFRLTGGVTFGMPKVQVHGMLVNAKSSKSIMDQESGLDPNNMPRITISDANDPSASVTIQPNGDASLDATILWRRGVIPYAGIGYGQVAPYKSVSFFFDFGVLFTGKIGLASPNVIAGDPNTLLEYDPRVQDIIYKAQFVPMINMGISIRLASF